MFKLLLLALKLMNKLKYSQKFILMSLTIFIMAGGILFLLLSNINGQVEFSQKERYGIEYIDPTRALLVATQQHRELMSLYLKGNSSVKSEIDARKAEIDNYIQKINEADQNIKLPSRIESRWDDLKQKLQSLESSKFFVG
ncbi:MAG: hypothetical protein M0C28_31355 [Candidatus Moduliflexus flocculans]|nr:hypothetical protein [Candidatus Moduliflexus flocculans]